MLTERDIRDAFESGIAVYWDSVPYIMNAYGIVVTECHDGIQFDSVQDFIDCMNFEEVTIDDC